MVPDMADRNNHMDETHHDLSNKHDSGGSRAKTYMRPGFSRSGTRSTRGSDHVTGCHSVNLSPGVNPPMFIYSSKAKNPQVKDSWIEGLARVKGIWGHREPIYLDSMFAARSEGSMDTELFMQYIPLASICLLIVVSIESALKFVSFTSTDDIQDVGQKSSVVECFARPIWSNC
jgi:hypothetical protein